MLRSADKADLLFDRVGFGRLVSAAAVTIRLVSCTQV
jgi:hypothetical protein